MPGIISCIALQHRTLAIKIKNAHGMINILDLNTRQDICYTNSELKDGTREGQYAYHDSPYTREEMTWDGYTLNLIRVVNDFQIEVEQWNFAPESKATEETAPPSLVSDCP